jgi:hypothetical protein
VIDRCADHRQAERRAHGAEEVERLGRDVALVVVERDHAVEAALAALVEDGVGPDGSAHAHPVLARQLDRRPQHADLLVAHHPALARVRVQRGQRDSRVVDAELAEQAVHAHDAVVHALHGQRVDRVAQREVAREEEDPQPADHEHREDAVGIGAQQVGEQLGVAGELQAAGARGLLVDRAGDDAVDGAFAGERASALDPLERGAAVGGVDLAEAGLGQVAEVEQVDRPALAARVGGGVDGADPQVEPGALDHLLEHPAGADDDGFQEVVGGALGERLGHDLGPDPGGIAERQREGGAVHELSFQRSSTRAASVPSSPIRPPLVITARPDHGPPATVPRAHSGATSRVTARRCAPSASTSREAMWPPLATTPRQRSPRAWAASSSPAASSAARSARP